MIFGPFAGHEHSPKRVETRNSEVFAEPGRRGPLGHSNPLRAQVQRRADLKGRRPRLLYNPGPPSSRQTLCRAGPPMRAGEDTIPRTPPTAAISSGSALSLRETRTDSIVRSESLVAAGGSETVRSERRNRDNQEANSQHHDTPTPQAAWDPRLGGVDAQKARAPLPVLYAQSAENMLSFVSASAAPRLGSRNCWFGYRARNVWKRLTGPPATIATSAGPKFITSAIAPLSSHESITFTSIMITFRMGGSDVWGHPSRA